MSFSTAVKSRLARLLLLALTVVSLPLVFIYDVIRAVVDLDLAGAKIVREILLVGAFISVAFLMRGWKGERRTSTVKEIGRLLVVLTVVAALFMTFFFLQSRSGSPGASSAGPDSVFAILRGSFVGLTFGLSMLWALLTIGDIVLFKRRKETRRNVVVFVVLLLSSCIAASPALPLQGSFLLSILMPLTIVASIVISFRQNWIVFLSRREKIYALIYSALLFLVSLFLVVLALQDGSIVRDVQEFSRPFHTFSQLVSILSAVFFGMSFITTLFHLPTAEVFERKQSEIHSLQNLSRLTAQVLDFNTLVQSVTQMTQEVCGASSVWLELVTKGKNGEWTSSVVAHRNIELEDVQRVTSIIDPAVRSLVLDARRVALIDDVWGDKRTKALREVNLLKGSLVSVPLVAQQSVIGILHASKEMDHGFDQDDVDVLTTFGDHVTIAIENAKLISRSIERERLQQELLVARRMQQQLLPQHLPQLDTVSFAAASESSTEVGGDYFDVMHLGGARWGLAVGDVSGKGVSAAFYMAEVKGIVLSLSRVCASPKELLVRANDALRLSLERRSFISLLYGVLDTRNGTFHLARAGHCPVILSAADGTHMLRPNGLGLGMADAGVFEGSMEEQVVRLRQGDVCVLYTDGITEARNAKDEEFGYDRLMAVVSAHRDSTAEETKIRILETVRTFAGGSAYMDDMTLVVFKWQNQTPSQSGARLKKENQHE